MVPKSIALFSIAFLCAAVNAETIDTKTLPDGKTVQIHTFDPGDAQFARAAKVISTFDENKRLLSVEQILQPAFGAPKGISRQVEFYGPDGKVDHFDMFLTPERAASGGVDRIVEYTDENDKTTRLEYYFEGSYIFAERSLDTFNRFPFFRLSFIRKVMFEDFQDIPQKTDFGLSVKYVSGRSVVRFVGQPVDMDEKDVEFLTLYLKSRSATHLLPLYHKKAKIREGTSDYEVLLQDNLLQYVKDQARAAVWYYIGVLDDRLELMGIGFTDIDD